MQNLTPISSYSGKRNNEIVLIDSTRLADWFDLPKDTPKIVCKTNIRGDLDAGWSLNIVENNQYTWLIGAKAGFKPVTELDVISLLGHNLVLMPWQKLVFCCEGESCRGMSYIDLGNSVSD